MVLRSTLVAALMFPGLALAEAHAPAQEQIDAVVAAIEANGCVITDENAPTILAALGEAGIDASMAQSILDVIGEAGEDPAATLRLTRGDAGVTLTSPNCPAQ